MTTSSPVTPAANRKLNCKVKAWIAVFAAAGTGASFKAVVVAIVAVVARGL